jgi:hypothetical protein
MKWRKGEKKLDFFLLDGDLSDQASANYEETSTSRPSFIRRSTPLRTAT